MSILVIAPHADDETLGMGGTIARFAREGKRVTVAVMTGHGPGEHPLWKPEFWEEIRGEAAEAARVLGVDSLLFDELPAACLADLPTHQVNRAVGQMIARADPEELYLPYFHDLHLDHEALAYAALVHARAYLAAGKRVRLVAMYETPTETHLFPAPIRPPFVPNMWVDISETLDAKLEAWNCYRSQHQEGPTPRSPEALRAQAVSRGAEVGVAAAEGFLVLRLTR
ncbi:MAG TPA: PIG-L deacetylase family protein [Allosphingosinicella sp.]|jgi:LmbE family N-acetylglucosaminyl deacetylase